MCASVKCECVLLQGEPGPTGPPGGPGEDGERVNEKPQFHTCLLCFLQHFLCSCISLRCVTELRLQSHLSHLLIIIIGKSRISVFNSILTYSPFDLLVEFHSHHSLSQSVLSILIIIIIFLLLISLSSPLYPQPMQPDPLSPCYFFLPSHHLSNLVVQTLIDPSLPPPLSFIPHSDLFSLFPREMMERLDPGDSLVNQ